MQRICQVELGFVPGGEIPKFSNRKTWLLHSLFFFELLKMFRNRPQREEQPPHTSMATIIIAKYEMFFSCGSRRISKSRAHVPTRRSFRERDGRTTQEWENGNLNFLMLRCSEYFNYGTPCVDGSGLARQWALMTVQTRCWNDARHSPRRIDCPVAMVLLATTANFFLPAP